MTIFYLPSWHRPFFSYLKPVSRCFRTSPLTHRSDRQISLPREYLYPYVTMWTVFQQAHCFREFFMFKKFTSWPNFSTHMFATQEKSEMLTLAEIFSLADISYKTFIKQPPNLSRGLLTGKRQSKKLPMKLTKLFSFLNLATHSYLQH